jgi:hypothetical protein
MRTTHYRVVALLTALALAPAAAVAGEWRTGAAPDQHHVFASFDKNGVSLVVTCDTVSKHVSISVVDPKARWPQGEVIDVITLPDSGQEVSPGHGYVIGPTQFVVNQQAAFDLWTMGQAKSVFRLSAGDYVRSYPAANFRSAVEPVLQACGERWDD